MNTKHLEQKDLLLLSKNEVQILSLFELELKHTPVTLARLCTIPRPTIYLVLESLKKRGLVYSIKNGNKKYWHKSNEDVLDEQLSKIKNKVSKNKLDYRKMKISAETDLTLFRGQENIIKLFTKLIDGHGGNRLITIQGDHVGDAWKKSFDSKEINRVNKKIIEKNMLTEMITSKKYFENQIRIFGQSWAENFTGRAAQIHFLDSKYLNYESQIFIFGHKIYLVSMSESLFIEIKNKQIAKLLISLIKFVEEHTPTVDINKLLREMINKKTPLV